MQRPKLRDGKRLTTYDLYPLNVFPDDLVRRLRKKMPKLNISTM